MSKAKAAASTKDKSATGGGAAKPGGQTRQYLPLGPDFSLHDRPQPSRPVQSGEPQGQRYTAEEIEVLRWALGLRKRGGDLVKGRGICGAIKSTHLST